MLNNIFQFLAAGPVRPALEVAFVLVPKVFIPAAWFNPANLAESCKKTFLKKNILIKSFLKNLFCL